MEVARYNIYREFKSQEQKTRQEREEARLLGYMLKWSLLSQQGRANFNLYKKESVRWTESSGMGSFIFSDAFNKDEDYVKTSWAYEMRNLISNTGFLLKTRMPKGLQYHEDRFQDDVFGIMVRPEYEAFKNIDIKDMIRKIYYMGRWYSPKHIRIRLIMQSLIKFRDEFMQGVKQFNEQTTYEDAVSMMHDAYERSGIFKVIHFHRRKNNVK